MYRIGKEIPRMQIGFEGLIGKIGSRERWQGVIVGRSTRRGKGAHGSHVHKNDEWHETILRSHEVLYTVITFDNF